jgi:hypothetical protein
MLRILCQFCIRLRDIRDLFVSLVKNLLELNWAYYLGGYFTTLSVARLLGRMVV